MKSSKSQTSIFIHFKPCFSVQHVFLFGKLLHDSAPRSEGPLLRKVMCHHGKAPLRREGIPGQTRDESRITRCEFSIDEVLLWMVINESLISINHASRIMVRTEIWRFSKRWYMITKHSYCDLMVVGDWDSSVGPSNDKHEFIQLGLR